MQALQGLNDRQLEATKHFEGPLLILAGAGSGKTRVLTNRIAWLIEEKGVSPWHILAITFTNKAAGEMRERVDRMVGFGAESIWVSTFHSMCARILRRYIEYLGYQSNFTIYDTDDQKTLMKEICKKLNLDTKVFRERMILGEISSAKNELIDPKAYEELAGVDYTRSRIAMAYTEYQKALKKNNALDFDDLLMLTVQLFEKEPEILASYQERFQFIMVDEYQDTNTAQFKLIALLAGKRGNLCVVGDDDQSIYRFRGANIQNILNFEKIYPTAKVVKLEQNYRSTQNILDAANVVIQNNHGRKAKALWTQNGQGEKVHLRGFHSAYEEAEFVARDIAKKCSISGENYGDYAVLYRTNAQSRLLEEKFLLANVPYRIVGGVNFYARKEIKDLLAYLKTIDNASDDLAVRRIINIPKRGIGATSIGRVQTYADVNGISFYEALTKAGEIPGIGRSASKLSGFETFIRVLRTKQTEYSVSALLAEIIEQTGYVRELEAEGTDEAKDRIANIDELTSKIVSYEQSTDEPTLSGFLEEVSLVADVQDDEDENGRVLLMTLHSAKGLEFKHVYLTGMEDGVFPSFMSITSDSAPEDIEEERRLCYVGITRAMQSLTLTYAESRMVKGQIQFHRVSRFIGEIPEEMLDKAPSAYSRASFMPAGSGASSTQTSTASSRTFSQTASPKPKIAYDLSQFKVKKADGLDYEVGDRVRHRKFGDGTVLSIVDGARDYEVSVEFDTAGVKKMFAAFAKLQKL